jgi:type IV pilus assembly protein PilA
MKFPTLATRHSFALLAAAIVGILPAVAIPQDQNTFRAAVMEGLVMAEAAKTAVIETYSSNPGVPIVAYGAGCPRTAEGSFGFACEPSTYVTDVQIRPIHAAPAPGDGTITITYSAASGVPGAMVFLVPGSGLVAFGEPAGPLQPGVPIVWGCNVKGNTALYPYVPANCRN